MNKRIGVLLPVVCEPLAQDLLYGIETQAKQYGYDTIAFTNALNFLPGFEDIPAEIGEENIFTLIEKAQLDGILFHAGAFAKATTSDRIMDILCTLDIPVLVIAKETDRLPYFFLSQSEGIRELTSHLITEHQCRTLYCLTGHETSYEAQQRLQGFHDALKEHGIPFRDDLVFYGNFWVESGKELAEKIAAGKLAVPDGIVCANDIMALSLCEELIKHGFKIPEQIKVTGYDGNIITEDESISITTISGLYYNMGAPAFCRIYEIIEEKN